jgi:hypothetical protein
MKSATTLLVGLVALLLLAITAALCLSVDSFVAAYVELQTQPESVSDIVLRSRTTASAPDPHHQSGMWFGAGWRMGGRSVMVLGSAAWREPDF